MPPPTAPLPHLFNIETLVIDELNGPKMQDYFNNVTARGSTPQVVNDLTFNVLNWIKEDETLTIETTVVLVFPVHKDGKLYCGLLIIPFVCIMWVIYVLMDSISFLTIFL